MVAVSSILPRAHIHHIHRCSGNLLLHSPFARNGWRMCCENLSMRDVCFTEGRSSSGPWTCPSLVRTHLGILSLLNGDIDHVGGDFSDIIVSSFIMCIYIYRYTHICIIYFLFTHTIRIQTSIYRGLHGPSRTREMLPGRRHLHAWLFLATVAIATRNHTVSKIAYIFAWFTVLDLLQGMVGDPDSEKWKPIPKNERVCLGSAIAT